MIIPYKRFLIAPIARRGLLGVALLSVVAIASCGEDQIRRGAKVASLSITTLRSLRDTNQSLLTRGKITADEARTNILLMQDASAAAGELNDRCREALEKIDAVDKEIAALPAGDPKIAELQAKRKQIASSTDFRPLISATLKTVRNLNEQGVLRVKNPDARAQLTDLMDFLLGLF